MGNKDRSAIDAKIEERIRLHKEINQKKFTNSTTFQKGSPLPSLASRKRNSKPKKRAYKATTQVRNMFQTELIRFLVELQQRDISELTVPQILDATSKMAKVVIPDASVFHVKNTEINKIEVSFSDEFGKTIDITPVDEIDIEYMEGGDNE